MQRYDVRALSATLGVVRLQLEAGNEQELHRQLAAQACKAISVRVARAQGAGVGRALSAHFSPLLFSQELLALLNAGLSLIEALEALAEKEASPQAAGVLAGLLGALREGRRFSHALTAQGQVFTPLYVGLVQAAEDTSGLPDALARYIGYQQRMDAVRGKLVNALIYPAILMAVGALVIAFLIGFVVPRFSVVYQGTGRELPWLSQAMIEWGRWAAENGTALSAGLAAALLGAGLAMRQLHRSGVLGRAIARLPGVGQRIRLYELSRVYLTLGMLLEGGMAAVTALRTAGAVASPATRGELELAVRQIQAGEALSRAFETQGLTTTISARLLRVGEQSGQLGAMLTQAAQFHEGEVNRFIERFMRAFEPILMAVIGAVVGLIVLLLYMPIFDLAGSLG